MTSMKQTTQYSGVEATVTSAREAVGHRHSKAELQKLGGIQGYVVARGARPVGEVSSGSPAILIQVRRVAQAFRSTSPWFILKHQGLVWCASERKVALTLLSMLFG